MNFLTPVRAEVWPAAWACPKTQRRQPASSTNLRGPESRGASTLDLVRVDQPVALSLAGAAVSRGQAAPPRYSAVPLQLVYASITALQLFAEESWVSIVPKKALPVRQAAKASPSKLLQQATKAISSPTHSLSRQHQWEQPSRAQSATQRLSQTILRAWGRQLATW